LAGNNLKAKAKFRNPEIPNGKEELKRIIPEYGAIGFATEIAKHMDISKNKAASFNQTIHALKEILRDESNQ
jgi:16S rRNA C1402 N4-methylase RsmH